LPIRKLLKEVIPVVKSGNCFIKTG
jgi:hypothetical protein